MLNREIGQVLGMVAYLVVMIGLPLSAEAMDSTLRIAIEASASINSGQLNVSADGFPQTSLLHDLNITVLVKESNIISPQLMPDDTRNPDYVHMNVLRDYVTDAWNTSFGTSPMVPGDTINGTYSFSLEYGLGKSQ